MNETIDHEWKSFSSACFRDISEQQYIDLRRTFYAGAAALYGLLMQRLDGGDEVTEHDIEMMHRLREEMRRFNEDVKAGIA
jgi:hypothetical protein